MNIMPKQFKGKAVAEGTESPWNVLEGTDISAIVALGIQAPPNTAFTINGGNEIYIGSTGIYELNLQSGNLGTINSLIIKNAKLIESDEISNNVQEAETENDNNKILIDILYKTTGQEAKEV